MAYDLIVVGGGIAGASLAKRMAEGGARVVVLERETEFRDRIRGECLVPWGVGEARQLGVADTLQSCSNEMQWVQLSINGQVAMKRDLFATTPQGAGMWGFYHPRGQEVLLRAAATAGAQVRRGATVRRIMPGAKPRVEVAADNGNSAELEGRLVAYCAGRSPALRTELGFETRRGSIPLLLSGIWVKELPPEVDSSVAYISNDVVNGSVSGLFQQPDGRARAYFGFHPQKCERLQGDASFGRFRDEFEKGAQDTIPFGASKPIGPLASFECVDVWVDHPYRGGVALVGDAASSNDPSWGQGLSLALRDARVLSDELLGNQDWAAAGEGYAQRHDQHYGTIRKVSGWFYDIFQRLGPEAEARRTHALPLLAQDPMRFPDQLYSGPDLPMADDARARFFGEC